MGVGNSKECAQIGFVKMSSRLNRIRHLKLVHLKYRHK
jgi:hypothetical protein